MFGFLRNDEAFEETWTGSILIVNQDISGGRRVSKADACERLRFQLVLGGWVSSKFLRNDKACEETLIRYLVVCGLFAECFSGTMKRMKSWVCKQIDDHADESRFESWRRQAFVGVTVYPSMTRTWRVPSRLLSL
jgi:hypothetical protein